MGSQITGGKISFGRTIKTGDYENKRADAEFHFSVDEGESYHAIASEAADAAQAHVYKVLGIAHTPAGMRTKTDLTAEAVEAATKPAPVEPAKAGRRKAPPAVQPADAAKVEEPAKVEEAKSEEPTKPADPAAVTDELFTAAPAKITDKDLTDAVTRKNEQIKNAVAIRGLIGKYGVQRLAELKDEVRQAFLDELAKL